MKEIIKLLFIKREDFSNRYWWLNKNTVNNIICSIDDIKSKDIKNNALLSIQLYINDLQNELNKLNNSWYLKDIKDYFSTIEIIKWIFVEDKYSYLTELENDILLELDNNFIDTFKNKYWFDIWEIDTSWNVDLDWLLLSCKEFLENK